jgi:histidine phosphotransferase ChpT
MTDTVGSDGRMSNALRLAELLAARLCHDLGGLAGPLAGTFELQAAGQVSPVEALATANEVALDLTRRVRLLRAAWGGDAAPMGPSRLRELAMGAPRANELRLDLSAVPASIMFSNDMARVLLNIVLLAGESLPRGGTLAFVDAGDGQVLAVLTGPRAAWPAGFAAVIADEAAAWDAVSEPRALLAPLTALLARSLGIRLSLLLPAGTRQRRRPPLLIAPALSPA